MTKIKHLSLLIMVFIAVSFKASVPVKADKTIVYIVRHGEKDLTDPKNPNPELSDEGRVRANDLVKVVKSQKFHAVFSTQFKRTMNTVAPIAKKYGLAIEFYDPKNSGALAELVLKKYKNKKVIIAGHSNTVLELVEAFGAKKPLSALTEEDYDLLFKVTVKGSVSELNTKRYGQVHHVTPLLSN